MGIEWQEGSVCYADGEQWHSEKESSNALTFGNFQLNFNDFQLNEPRIGDYLPKSELDTEQKYNDAVEVFGLFGFNFCGSAISEYNNLNKNDFITCCDDGLWQTSSDRWNKRKLTYNQLIAIGKLKRLMNERDNLKRCGGYSGCVKVDLGDVKEKEVAMQKNKPVVAQVMIDLTERMEIGIKTYGEALRANNGRDALQDAYEEALDLACYLKQAMIERDNENTN